MEEKQVSRSGFVAATASVAMLAISACASSSTHSGFANKKVCIDQYATASVISDLLTGIQDGLATAKSQGLAIDVKNPDGDAGTEQTIDQQFLSSGCNVIVPVGTAAAALAAHNTSTIPIVFAASSTPVQAHLVQSLSHPGGNVTGVSDVLPVDKDEDAFRQIMPNLNSVGLIWKNGDPAGDPQAAAAHTHLASLGINAVNATINSASDVTTAVESLVGKVQAIEIPGDTTTISAAAGITKAASDNHLPVFGGTTSAVKAGAILSGTYDYKTVGESVAQLVLKVLNGAKPADTAVVLPPLAGFDLNITQAKKLGLTIPDSVLAKAVNKY